MLLLRRLLIAVFAAAAVACTQAPTSSSPAAETAADGPVDIVRALYAPYLAGDAVIPPGWDAAPLSDEVRTLLAQAAAANDGQDPIGADPIIMGQDYLLSGLNVALDAPPVDRRAVVTARFSNMGTATQVHYDFVEIEDGWRIDNIRSEIPAFDLRADLAAAISGENIPN